MEPLVPSLGSLPTVLTSVWDSAEDLVTSIASQPLLLIGVGFTFAFGVVKLARRMMKRG